MEKLKHFFADAEQSLSLIVQKLSSGQFLTDQDCIEAVRLINELSQEKQRLKGKLAEEGVDFDFSGCTSIDDVEEILADCRRRREERDRLLGLRMVVTDFSSIRAIKDVYREELEKIQSDLAVCDDEKLVRMEESGRLELYRKFIHNVRVPQEDMEDVDRLTGEFGYKLAFALLKKDLTLAEDGASFPVLANIPSAPKREKFPPDCEILEAMYPVKYREASADGFRNALKRFPAEANILLPALSQMGVLNVELAVRFSALRGWDVTQPNQKQYAEQVENVFRLLSEKGFTTGYQTREQGIVYCLTKYGYDCLHMPMIIKNARDVLAVPIHKRKNNSFFIPVGYYKFLGDVQMDAGRLQEAFGRNQDIERYLSCLQKQKHILRLSDADMESVLRSFTWKNNHYVIKVPICGKYVLCQVCHNMDDCVSGAALFLTSVQPEKPWEEGPVVFCDGRDIFYWNHGWIPAVGVLEEMSGVTDEEAVEKSGEEACGKAGDIPEECGRLSVPECPEPIAATEGIDIVSCDAQENAKRLLEQQSVRLEDLLKLTVRLISENRFAEAVVLAETWAKDPHAPTMAESFYQALRQSVQVPGNIYGYDSEVINQQQGALSEEDSELRTLQQAMILANLLWAMAFPTRAYDHNLYNNARMTVSTTEDETIQSLITLLSEELKDLSFQYDGLGFSTAIISGLMDNGERERQIKELCTKASDLKRTPTSTIGITGLETCLKQMVGPASIIGCALLWIEEDNREEAETIRAMLGEELGVDFLKSDGILENYIDQCWNSLRKADSHVKVNIKVKRLDNDTPARKVCKKALTDRIAVIKDWLDSVQSEQRGNFQQFRDGYARILNKLKALLNLLTETAHLKARPYEEAGRNILRFTAAKMLAVLEGRSWEEQCFNYSLYLTPELMLEENGGNRVVPELYGIPGLEPWNFVLRAVAAGPEEPETILEQIGNYQVERWYRNFGNEAFLYACMGRACPDLTQGIQNARRDAEQAVQKFKSNTRLNRAYGKIQEHEMETAFSVLDLVKGIYFQSHNYASFKGFLKQLNEGLDQKIEARAVQYEARVRKLGDEFSGTEMLDVIRRALEKRNFNSVDSYINQLQSGDTELLDSDWGIERKTNFFAQFQDCEDGYFQECHSQSNRSANLARWGERALESMNAKYQHWTSPNEKKKGCSWLGSWIMRKDDANNNAKVQNVLTGLGFIVKTRPVRDDSFPRASEYEVFRVSAEKTSSGLKDYSHPVYKFGTDLRDPMYVVCLYGRKGASTLIEVMAHKLQLNGPTIVLMDGPLTVSDRRLVAERFKADTSGQSPFLLIDRVLALYLASLNEGDRQKAMLHCTLPYTFEVLYGSGSGAVPEEMFIGRVGEMNDLRNEQGPCLVYGGRQLGKTALLNRASKTIHNPQNLNYSFCVDIKDEGSEVLLEKVNRNLLKLGLLDEPCLTLKDLCEMLRNVYDDGKIRRLQIFVDEVDELFNEFGRDDFKALRPFIVLRDATNHHVKFVFAGTHNVAATDKADMENSNLVHMGKPLCIEPLSPCDAIKLIRIPMSYLGFEIGDSQIELILSNTNSYPGLIHMFCNALVQSVCRDYEIYYSSGETKKNPPYYISDEQMRAVFKEKDIRKEIGTRVMATIKLNRKYRVISWLLAHMVYEDLEREQNRLYGYGARELLDYNQRELQISLLEVMSEKDLEALLDEMVRMGILWKNVDRRQFRFRQQDFLNFIGTSDQVIELLLKENSEGV